VCRQPTDGKSRGQFPKVKKNLFVGAGGSIPEEARHHPATAVIITDHRQQQLHRNSSASNSSKSAPYIQGGPMSINQSVNRSFMSGLSIKNVCFSFA